MPRYCVEVEERATTLTVYQVEVDADDAIDAERRVNEALAEGGTAHRIPTLPGYEGATVELDGEEPVDTSWDTASVWEVVEQPDVRQTSMFPQA